MPKRIAISSKEYLKLAKLPEQTETYTVIPHGFVMDTTEKTLLEKGFSIVKEQYACNEGGQVAKGIYYLNQGDDPEMKMMVSWANSYDKTMRFKFSVGAYLLSSEACMLSEHIGLWNRKHTGSADKEAETSIQEQLANAFAYYNQMVLDKEAMKAITIDKKQAAEMLGRLFFEKMLITSEQLNIIKGQYRSKVYNYNAPDDSLWVFYCNVIYSLKKAHPKNWMDQQRLIHLFIAKEFGFGKITELVTAAEAVATEPVPTEQDTTEVSAEAPIMEEKVTEVEQESVLAFEQRTHEEALKPDAYLTVVRPSEPEVVSEVAQEVIPEVTTEVMDAPDTWFCLECNTEQKPEAVFYDGQLCESCHNKLKL